MDKRRRINIVIINFEKGEKVVRNFQNYEKHKNREFTQKSISHYYEEGKK